MVIRVSQAAGSEQSATKTNPAGARATAQSGTSIRAPAGYAQKFFEQTIESREIRS